LRWTWDQDKNPINRRKHKLQLSIGDVALADRLALSGYDPHPDGDRWDTLCQAGTALLFIVHPWPDDERYAGPHHQREKGNSTGAEGLRRWRIPGS
jgi:uncharacterized DUF497 family protein